MAGANTRISVEVDDRQIVAALRGLLDRTGDLTPALQEIGEHLLFSTRDRFERQEDPEGRAWAPLSPAYQATKPRNAGKILVLSGDLLGLLRYQVDSQGVAVGTDRIYGAAMQFGMPRGYAGQTQRGSPIPWGDIPARPFLGLSDADREVVLEILEEHLAR